MRAPTEPRGYRFSLQSSPAKEISYTTSSYGNEKGSLYDRMASSAFMNFRTELVKRLGIQKVESTTNSAQPQRVKPTTDSVQQTSSSPKSVSDARTSHPIVNGVFASQLGRLRITGSNTGGFAFKIDLNSSGCSGAVDGSSEWSDENTAGYGSIPNRTEYDDPNSAYYRQTCQLIFITSQNSVEVRETFGCTYLHNTVCFFEGTYKRIGR